MFDSTRLLLFLTAALLLAVAPGPGMLYVLARSLAGGKREGVLSALGTFVGGMVHVFAAALGISVVLARSALAFSTVKYVGAAYLCFLGVRMILDARKPETSLDDFPSASGGAARNPLWQGVATEVLNPKTALFFLSFIHPAVRQSGCGTSVRSVCVARHYVGGPEYVRRSDRNRASGTVGEEDSLVGSVPAPAANRNRRDHDRAGDVPGDEREQIALD